MEKALIQHLSDDLIGISPLFDLESELARFIYDVALFNEEVIHLSTVGHLFGSTPKTPFFHDPLALLQNDQPIGGDVLKRFF